ncbi:MAG: hypothetical protein ACM3ZB_06505 [bacterium]
MNTEGTQRIAATLNEIRDAVRQDLVSAWSGRLGEVFAEETDRALAARTDAMLSRLLEAVQFEVGWMLAAEVDAASPEIAARASREAGERFSRAVRKLLEAREGPRPLSEAAAELAGRVLLFNVVGTKIASEDGSIQVEIDSAPAFQNAVEERETVIALRTPGELSAPIAALGTADRCYLFPVAVEDTIVAVIYAEGERVDVAALEALAAVAGALAERDPAYSSPEEDIAEEARANAVSAGAGDLVLVSQISQAANRAAAAPPEQAGASAPPIVLAQTHAAPIEPTPEELKARHFARIRVAEMLLYRHDAVRSGRESRDIYSALRKEIDSARDVYASQFGALEDYLHAELVQTLARGDAGALGDGYPGPLS